LAKIRTQGLAYLSTSKAMISIKRSLITLPNPKLLTRNEKKKFGYTTLIHFEEKKLIPVAAVCTLLQRNLKYFFQTALIKSKI
jgi:hypothetical protein